MGFVWVGLFVPPPSRGEGTLLPWNPTHTNP